jgi:hypothetical protein
MNIRDRTTSTASTPRPPGRRRKDGLRPGSPEAEAADRERRRLQQRARRAAERAVLEERQQALDRIAGLRRRGATYLSIADTARVLREETGRAVYVRHVLKLIEDGDLIATDSEPPRVFTATVGHYLHRILLRSWREADSGRRERQERPQIEDPADRGPGLLILELLGEGYRDSPGRSLGDVVTVP